MKNIGTIKTTQRKRDGIIQTIRLFTKSQREYIKNEVKNRGDLTILEILNLYGVQPTVYYSWIRTNKSTLIDLSKFDVDKILSSIDITMELLKTSKEQILTIKNLIK